MTGFRGFWLPRRGNSPEEYEDAFADNVPAGRYALADGASESPFAAEWAKLLVEDFVAGFVEDTDRDPGDWTESLDVLQERLDVDLRSRQLPWFAQEKLELGAFATFLGVVLMDSADETFRWQAVAVGDSCLFHTRDTALLKAFPLDRSIEFNNSPQLVASRMSPKTDWRKRSLRTSGSGTSGDRLWMMTDALAQWCLKEHERGRNPWGEMESRFTTAEPELPFAAWIEGLRDMRGLANDDVTLMAISP